MGTAFMGLGADHELPELGWIQRGLDHIRRLVEQRPWPCAALIAASRSRGCRVRPPHEILEQLSPEMRLEGLRLHKDGGALEMPALVVTELHIDEDWRPNLLLEARGEDHEAALWLIMEKLTQHEDELDDYTYEQLRQLPKVPARGLYTEDARVERLDFLHEHTGHELEHTRQTQLMAEKLTGNIENFIGGVEVPLGLAGPLLFRGEEAREVMYLPMATSEGALVASSGSCVSTTATTTWRSPRSPSWRCARRAARSSPS